MPADIPADLKYTRDHEWVLLQGKTARVGITNYAQRQLGDIVFVELPKEKDKFDRGQPFGTVESVKSVSELYAPLSGTVAAVNQDLNEAPEDINGDPYGDGWMIELTLTSADELKDLLTAAEYEGYLKEE
ncbi:glycine cleavage system protein GcvH [Kitasatospora aureofaciens]|uniref:Glycine cleavage system H protein n=2 Tax=Kitasatospora aureofaciens TaxID=1894 RepID=A0A1E7N6E8_KITAU|nr:glycine cleavage system protein GcvH [Kitasatospora aureofaciens]QEV01085.1 glycine cleavage system protein GcvH [Streptomyces viridifaciens]ARF79836.1 glycine cleavage system protein H [Kitasatospora aureofaciens]OEV36224.1 glycine cleavage system protein H [Kitasatospora aureofaciens]UKZ07434.1 glycine cleavage system protein GcvH [Streptomyces viridifaciens]GGU86552.1 glycine cleavage system H protein [Kitasatospora aureofaciens]